MLEQLTVKDSVSRRPVTVMPRHLPSKAVAARGQYVSLLQAAKHAQAKPETVGLRKLRQGAEQQRLNGRGNHNRPHIPAMLVLVFKTEL